MQSKCGYRELFWKGRGVCDKGKGKEVSKISHQYMKILTSNNSQFTREISKKEENFEGYQKWVEDIIINNDGCCLIQQHIWRWMTYRL